MAAPANPTKAGYTFNGWNPAVPATMPAANTTCIAQWTVVPTYTVTFQAGANGSLTGTTSFSNIASGTAWASAVSVPTPAANTGYSYNNWTPSFPSTITASATHTANFVINQYTITFNSDGGSAVSPITQNYGTVVAAPANPTKAGYTFNGWNPAVPATMPAANTTCIAQWTVVPTYTVTFNANDGSGTMSNQTANIATALTTNTFTRSGYNFSGWNNLANGKAPTTRRAGYESLRLPM